MTTPTPETPDGLIVGFDVSAGRDETALVFAKRLPNGAMEIVASLRGEAAEYVESLRKRLAEAERVREAVKQDIENGHMRGTMPLTVAALAHDEEAT